MDARLAFIGIGYFFSAWFIIPHHFEKNVPRFLQRHVPILCYTMMLTSIDLMV
ncbi:hypothetical protein KQH61_03375 [bacterium]|nr:hypothetical protein [bacterium]